MKNFVKLFSLLMVVLVLTGSAFAYLANDNAIARSSDLGKADGQAVYATHGKNVYWLTASIDEYENKPGNLSKVTYAR
jgi:hypothetical protein